MDTPFDELCRAATDPELACGAQRGDHRRSDPAFDARERPAPSYDRAKHERGPKLHTALDRLGHVLALRVTAADVDDLAERTASRTPPDTRAAVCKRDGRTG